MTRHLVVRALSPDNQEAHQSVISRGENPDEHVQLRIDPDMGTGQYQLSIRGIC